MVIFIYLSCERYAINFDWLFYEGSQDLAHEQCTANNNFKKISNQFCDEFFLINSIEKNNINEYANACCANPTCAYFQMDNNGLCYTGNIMSIYNAFSWTSTCKSTNDASFYSRYNYIPDINPNHFSAAMKSFNDKLWLNINIPNDFIVNGTVEQYTNVKEPRTGSHGYLPKNVSWYRKHFSLDTKYNNNNTILFIDFDGIS